ncbi:MAG: 30S ribosomal protein S6 [Fidelibacterota bacterium]
MRYYETLYIVNANYEEERQKTVQQEVDQWVSKKGGKIINSYVWGKRKLAYPVDKQKYGTYMLLNFGTESRESTEKPFISEFNSWMELHTAILAYLTVHLDGEPATRDPEGRKRGEVSGKEDRKQKEKGRTKTKD